MILLEIENALARREIEICAVQLIAKFQAGGEGLFGHAGIENLALELVDALNLRVQGSRGEQRQRDRTAQKALHVQSPIPMAPPRLPRADGMLAALRVPYH